MKGESPTGLVVLVGAGPGDAQLITLAGLTWLKRADAVVYDRLVPPGLLAAITPRAQCIYAGKGRAGTALTQDQINELLVILARTCKVVVRLKGGDPFIFGRGGEEAAALKAAGVPYRVVPGVTAAVAGAAYAGIPLTDRRLASSVALVTGQEGAGREQPRVNYDALAGIDTVVFYMGVKNLPEIADGLLEAGRKGDTPAAVIERATTGRQRTIRGTLQTIVDLAGRADVRPPALVVIGDVVGLGEQLAWRRHLPLDGRTIVVARAARQASDLAEALADLGADVIEAPAIEIAPPADWTQADAAIREMGEFQVVCFTSPNGVAAMMDRALELGIDARALAGVRIAAVGPATADALRRRSLLADVIPETFTTEALGQAVKDLGGLAGKRVLLARTDIAPPRLAETLRLAGAAVQEIAVYRTLRPAGLPPPVLDALREGAVDWITFTSSSTVENFLAMARPAAGDSAGAADVLGHARLASIGPVTTEALRARGLSVHAEAAPHTIDGLVRAILAASAGRASQEVP